MAYENHWLPQEPPNSWDAPISDELHVADRLIIEDETFHRHGHRAPWSKASAKDRGQPRKRK
jgi:hypothetical protein